MWLRGLFVLSLLAAFGTAAWTHTEACPEHLECTFGVQIKNPSGVATSEFEFNVAAEGGDESSRFFRLTVSDSRPIFFEQSRSGVIGRVISSSQERKNERSMKNSLLRALVRPVPEQVETREDSDNFGDYVAVFEPSRSPMGGLVVMEKREYKASLIAASRTSVIDVDGSKAVSRVQEQASISSSSSSSAAVSAAVEIERLGTHARVGVAVTSFAQLEQLARKELRNVVVSVGAGHLELPEPYRDFETDHEVMSRAHALFEDVAMLTSPAMQSKVLFALSQFVTPSSAAAVIRLAENFHGKSKLSDDAVAQIIAIAGSFRNSNDAQAALVDCFVVSSRPAVIRRAAALALLPSFDMPEYSLNHENIVRLRSAAVEAFRNAEAEDELAEVGLLLLGALTRYADANLAGEIANDFKQLLAEHEANYRSDFESRYSTILRALGNMGGSVALASIVPHLNATSPRVRAAAVDALRFMDLSLDEAARARVALMAAEDKDAAVAHTARILVDQAETFSAAHLNLVSRSVKVPTASDMILAFTDLGIDIDKEHPYGTAALLVKGLTSGRRLSRLIDSEFMTRVNEDSVDTNADSVAYDCNVHYKVEGFDIGSMSHATSTTPCLVDKEGKSEAAAPALAKSSPLLHRFHDLVYRMDLPAGVELQAKFMIASSLALDLYHAHSSCEPTTLLAGVAPRGNVYGGVALRVVTSKSHAAAALSPAQIVTLFQGSAPMAVRASAPSRACAVMTAVSGAVDTAALQDVNGAKVFEQCIDFNVADPHNSCWVPPQGAPGIIVHNSDSEARCVRLVSSQNADSAVADLEESEDMEDTLAEEPEEEEEENPELEAKMEAVRHWQQQGAQIDMAAFRTYDAAKNVQQATASKLEAAIESEKTGEALLEKYVHLSHLAKDALDRMRAEWGHIQAHGEQLDALLKNEKSEQVRIDAAGKIAENIRTDAGGDFEQLRQGAKHVLKAGQEAFDTVRRMKIDRDGAMAALKQLPQV